MPAELVQLVLGGLLLGGIYGLAAFGLSISFGVLNVLNLAHGEFLMLGSLTACALFLGWGLNPFISAVLLIPVFMAVGMLFYFLLLKPAENKSPKDFPAATILITLGASLVIQDLASLLWNRPVSGIDYSLPAVEVGDTVIPSVRLLILLFVCIVAVVLQWYLLRTMTGKAIRAVVESRLGAMLAGISIEKLSSFTFGLGVGLAASAGVLYVTLFAVTPTMGMPLTIKCLCVVVLGGLGSLTGSVVGGLILGLAEVTTAYLAGAQWSPCIAFLLLIAVLVVSPGGLFARR